MTNLTDLPEKLAQYGIACRVIEHFLYDGCEDNAIELFFPDGQKRYIVGSACFSGEVTLEAGVTEFIRRDWIQFDK